MEVKQIIAELDQEIARLKTARDLLVGAPSGRKVRKKATASAGRKNRMSADGRRRIAEAMKKRWAERRKQQRSQS